MHQLLILGNGFDMACGLQSSFAAFHHSRFDSAGKFICGKPTIWDYILKERYEDKDPNWSDVESALSSLLLNDELSFNTLMPYLSELPEINACTEASKCPPDQPVLAPNKTWPSDQKAVFDYLYEQLSLYENELSKYLSNQVADQYDSYTSEAQVRLNALINDIGEGPDICDQQPHTSILSFNYTRPIDCDTLAFHVMAMLLITYKNVHGELGRNNIVIGVDATQFKDKPYALPFTKTYRLLALDPVKENSLLHTKPSYADDSTRIIKVFGHSLAPADYSYFQAIFDEIDLYSSSVKLFFYYEPHGIGSKIEQETNSRMEQYHAVTNLLNSYGQSFNNKDHGKNLMHKLLLEGRLLIRNIEDAYDSPFQPLAEPTNPPQYGYGC